MLTEIEKIRLEIGVPVELMSDTDIEYFLEKNGNSIRKASLDVAKAVLFQLAQMTHFKAAELEDWAQEYFKQYMEALKLYISDPNYNIAIQGAMPYAGGVSRADIQNNMDNVDTNYVRVEKGIPVDGEAISSLNNTSAFEPRFPTSAFNI